MVINKFAPWKPFIINIPVIILFCFLGSCANKREQKIHQKVISDPYVQSFWGKSIKLMVWKNLDDSSDTLKFDKKGNIIEEVSIWGYPDRAEFDKDHLLTRYQIGSDIHEHGLVSYDTNENILIQKWIRVIPYDWDYKREDLKQVQSWYSVFIFSDDDYHRLVKEVNLKENYIVSYSYKGKLLTRRDRYNLIISITDQSRLYFYENDILTRIEDYYLGDHENVPDIIRYFNNGTLDSTQRISSKGTIDHTEVYKYVYF